jgi:hypothetical protein
MGMFSWVNGAISTYNCFANAGNGVQPDIPIDCIVALADTAIGCLMASYQVNNGINKRDNNDKLVYAIS